MIDKGCGYHVQLCKARGPTPDEEWFWGLEWSWVEADGMQFTSLVHSMQILLDSYLDHLLATPCAGYLIHFGECHPPAEIPEDVRYHP